MQYIAFLRGIMPTNPNMRNEKLKQVFEGLGFKNVQTVIASGNVIFTSNEKETDRLETMIEDALHQQLGFKSTTIIWSQQRLLQLLDADPFKGIEDSPSSKLNITFLKKPNTSVQLPHHGKGYVVLKNVDSAVCSSLDLSGAGTLDVMAWMEKQFGKEITTRTWKTVHRILKKMG